MPSTPPKDATAKNSDTSPATPTQLAEAAVEYVPESFKPYAEKVAPVVGAFGNGVIATLPYLQMAYDACYKFYLVIQPYQGLETAIIGFVYLFFGGAFITTIAAWEAFKMCGYDETMRCLRILYDSYAIAKAASDKDDQVDDDGDGIADVKQIDASALVQRKALVMLKVLDPQIVSEAAAGAWGGIMGVVGKLIVTKLPPLIFCSARRASGSKVEAAPQLCPFPTTFLTRP